MSKTTQHITNEPLRLETGLEALETSSDFRGPVEALGDHDSNDHLALIYENRDEQFAAAIPFIKQGLEAGEQCLYIVDENSTETVIEAMEAGEIDVETALESDALKILTAQDTYLRNGTFDPDDMISFLSETIDTACEEFEALRITGEMTWIFGNDPEIEDLIEYEGKLNRLLPEANSIALCQYNRKRFSASAIRDIIKTHPHLVYDNTVCQNFYYTPPEEFFGPEQPDREIDRMMGTLLDRTEARTELQDRQQHLQTLYEITADVDRTFDEKLQDLFELGCDRFDLELGGLAMMDQAADQFEIEATSDDHDYIVPGGQVQLSETYCRLLLGDESTAAVTDPVQRGFEDAIIYEEFGLRTYLGTRIPLENSPDRTFFFVSTGERTRPFSESERTFHHLMGQWVAYELERRQREQALERSNARLEQSNERLEQFAYAASHDLQEPLRMISSYLQLLERRYGNELDDDGEEFVDFAVDGAERMREMIDGLLEYSRIETQGAPLEPVDLNDVFEDVRTDLQFQLEESSAEVTTDSLPCVSGDESQLRQVVQNLLSNAITYSGEEPPRIDVSAERGCDEWILSISDEGIGIDPDDADRIFDVFDRLHTQDEHPGTGIGLAVCKRIVERHDGRIWADSEPGEGSTFSFTLPASDGCED